MVAMGTIFSPKRKLTTWRLTIPNIMALLVAIFVIWQVSMNFSQLNSHLPSLVARRSLHEFNETQVQEPQAQLDLQKSQQLLANQLNETVDKTADMVRLAMEKLQGFETQVHDRLATLEDNIAAKLDLAVSNDSMVQLAGRGHGINPVLDNKTITQLEALTTKILKMDEQIQQEIHALKQEEEKLRLRGEQFLKHIADTPAWKPLKDLTKFSINGFISEITGRGMEVGPPEMFEFPSAVSNARHLCFLGNNSSNGTKNFYTFAWADALPKDHILLNGTTLISETYYNYENPWHSMYNLVQFVYWKQVNACQGAERLLLYHWSELRRNLGAWISHIFSAASLPTVPEQMAIGDRPICFEKAVMSRTGIGGVPTDILRTTFAEVRCLTRNYCGVPVARPGPSTEQALRITLMVRSQTRAWKNVKAWEAVVASECARVQGCHWGVMPVANLSFCEQVRTMSKTDILLSVHGAQLANMIFMSPGGRVLEMFPKGWLELAGHGQYIYRNLAEWTGLTHEGYWRDLQHPDCPTPSDKPRCMSYFKDLSVGINVTHIAPWLRNVIADFNAMQADMTKPLADRASGADLPWDSNDCTCSVKSSISMIK